MSTRPDPQRRRHDSRDPDSLYVDVVLAEALVASAQQIVENCIANEHQWLTAGYSWDEPIAVTRATSTMRAIARLDVAVLRLERARLRQAGAL